ncbi:WD40 repeat domain-containing protein [candidate division WOR-3 bacterium]|nr:WD40 repeat domain-containing protein [candidate division WOR-3 bacterium]
MRKKVLWLVLGLAFLGCGRKPVHLVYEGSPVAIDSFQTRVTTLATIPGSTEIVLGFSDSVVMIWNPDDHNLVRELHRHSHIINEVAVSADGKLLAIASADKIFTVNELSTGKLIDSVYMLSGPAMTLDFSTDGAFLAVGYGEGAIQIWDLEKRHRHAKFEEHKGVVTGVKFRPGSHLMYSIASDSFLYITNVEGGDSSSRMKQMYGSLSAIAFSPDGQYCATGGVDQLVKVWRVWKTPGNDSLTSVGWYQSDLDRVRDISFSPDGSLIAAVDQAGQIVFLRRYEEPQEPTKKGWHAGGIFSVNLLEVGRFTGHAGAIRTVSFSADGSYLYTGGDDMTLKTWDVKDILAELEQKKAALEEK